MNLGRLIERLKNLDPKQIVGHGFYYAHSHRGSYEQLAFEPKTLVSVADMLSEAEGARGKVFTGYKGGEYLMDDCSEIYIAEYGCCGEQLTDDFFRYADEEQDNARLRSILAARDERVKELEASVKAKDRAIGIGINAAKAALAALGEMDSWRYALGVMESALTPPASQPEANTEKCPRCDAASMALDDILTGMRKREWEGAWGPADEKMKAALDKVQAILVGAAPQPPSQPGTEGR